MYSGANHVGQQEDRTGPGRPKPQIIPSPANTEGQRQDLSVDSRGIGTVIAGFGVNLGMRSTQPVGDACANVPSECVTASGCQCCAGLDQTVGAYYAPPDITGKADGADGNHRPGQLPGAVIPTYAADPIESGLMSIRGVRD